MSQRNTKLGGDSSPNTMPFDPAKIETLFTLLCSPVNDAKLLRKLNALYPIGHWEIQTPRLLQGAFPIDPLSERLSAQTFLLHRPYESKKCLHFNAATLPDWERRLLRVFFDCYNRRLRQNVHHHQLQRHQNCDPLTQLPNQGAFQTALKNAIQDAEQAIGVMVLDINGLKRVNDSQGHLKGDALLKKVARFLRAICRQSDAVFRIGGDEFVILLHKGTIQSCRALNARIEAQKSVVFSAETDEIGLSMGWACSQLHDRNQLFNIADKNMYCQKRRFYNRFFSKIIN